MKKIFNVDVKIISELIFFMLCKKNFNGIFDKYIQKNTAANIKICAKISLIKNISVDISINVKNFRRGSNSCITDFV